MTEQLHLVYIYMCVCVCVYIYVYIYIKFSLSICLLMDTCCFPDRFPDSSADKWSTCNAGDPSLLPGLERSPGEGIGYPLQYSWASLVAQLVKNLPAVRETPGLGRSPGEGKGYPLQYSGLENFMDCIVHGVTKSQTWLNDLFFFFRLFPYLGYCIIK